MVDSPSALDWNPCRDIARQAITARLLVGDVDVTATNKCKFFFIGSLNTGALEQITDGNGDNDWEFVSLTKNVLTIDRDDIGARTDLRRESIVLEGRCSFIQAGQ